MHSSEQGFLLSGFVTSGAGDSNSSEVSIPLCSGPMVSFCIDWKCVLPGVNEDCPAAWGPASAGTMPPLLC